MNSSNTNDIFPQKGIPKPIGDEKKNKKSSFIQSGHYVDLKLRHEKPNKNSDYVDESKISPFKLTTREEQILNSIALILFTHSHDKETDKNNKPINSKTYLKGNNQPTPFERYGPTDTFYPNIKFKAIDLYKITTGDDKPATKKRDAIDKALKELSNKEVNIIYDRKYKDDKNIQRTDRIEFKKPLINILNEYKELTNEEKKILDKNSDKEKINSIKDKKGYITLILNPIFVDQIETKYVKYPEDLNKITLEAYYEERKEAALANNKTPSKAEIPMCVIKLRDVIFRKISVGKESSFTLNKETLIYALGLQTYREQRQYTKIDDLIDRSITTCKKLNILLKVEQIKRNDNQDQYKFYINKDYWK